MPELKPSTVVLILAVVLVVAVYVLGVGLGATDRSESRRQPAVTAEERQRWRERFLKPRPVEAEELSVREGSSCKLAGQELSVTQGQTCRLVVAEDGLRGRTLEVVPQGALVSLDYTPAKGPALPVSEDNFGDAKRFDVMGEGGELEVRCVRSLTGSPALCRVLLR